MKSLLFIALLLLSFSGLSQIPGLEQGTTRAVVIGISDYQDDNIPNLKYAHKDAIAFANWLASPNGGKVPIDNIQLFTNKQANTSYINIAIHGLLEDSNEGDLVIIYFSGHGDMEAKILGKLGTLLLWDSPPYAYVSGGLPIQSLVNIISTLSVKKKCRVLIIADACHAGKLAGNEISGTRLVNENLLKQYANEQKILSCEIDEYSIEGVQWGGGRGAFSYHLTNGLYGLADKNQDQKVTLLELEHYLQDNVPLEVKPLSQNPIAIGNKNEVIAELINDSFANTLKNKEEIPAPYFSGVEQRGLIQELLGVADTSIKVLFLAFQKALDEKRFSEPKNHCAEHYYQRLLELPELEPLYKYFTRNYAAALLVEVQQSINAYLKSENKELFYRSSRPGQFHDYPQLVNKAQELLGQEHYMCHWLETLKNYFQGVAIRNDALKNNRNIAQLREAMHYQRVALKNEPQSALILNEIANLHFWMDDGLDSILIIRQKVVELAPTWAIANHNLSQLYRSQEEFEKAFQYAQLAVKNKPDYVYAIRNLGLLYLYKKESENALNLYLKTIKANPEYLEFFYIVAILHASRHEYKEAIEVLNRDTVIRAYDISEYHTLMGFCLDQLGKVQEGKDHYDKLIKKNEYLGYLDYFYQALAYGKLGYKNKFELTMKALENELKDDRARYYHYARGVYGLLNEKEKSLAMLEKAFQNGWKPYASKNNDLIWGTFYNYDFNAIRDTDAFKSMIKKYFPEQTKD